MVGLAMKPAVLEAGPSQALGERLDRGRMP